MASVAAECIDFAALGLHNFDNQHQNFLFGQPAQSKGAIIFSFCSLLVVLLLHHHDGMSPVLFFIYSYPAVEKVPSELTSNTLNIFLKTSFIGKAWDTTGGARKNAWTNYFIVGAINRKNVEY